MTALSRGVRFVRRESTAEKDKARGALLRLTLWLSGGNRGPGFSMLTMPGMDWSFEWGLLAARESRPLLTSGSRKVPRRTFIEAIESDPLIYRGAMRAMPGNWDIQFRESIPCAKATVRTPLVMRFHRCELEEYAIWNPGHQLDAAWLDFNGPITPRRLDAVQALWRDRLRRMLAITVMAGRDAYHGDDSRVAALVARLPGARMMQRIRYADHAPMLQLVFLKPRPATKHVPARAA